MTKNNSFAYFDDAIVSRAGNRYKVVLTEEDVTFFLREELVNAIVAKSGEDENLIAIILAYIEYIRISSVELYQKPPLPLGDKVLIETMILLLKPISTDELICKIKVRKWHEIVNIFESNSPIQNMIQL